MSVKLKIEERKEGQNPRQIRLSGFIPVSLYGKGIEPKNGQVSTHEFEMAYKNNSEENWELSFGKDKINAKIQELQKNYATSEFLNIEFQVI